MTTYSEFPGEHRRYPPKHIAEMAAQEMCQATDKIIKTCAKADPTIEPQRALMAVTIGIAFLIKYTADQLAQKGRQKEVHGIMIGLIKQHLEIGQGGAPDSKNSFRRDLSELIDRAAATGADPDDVCDVLLDTMMLISGGDDATAQ